jgi:hypothetical protein
VTTGVKSGVGFATLLDWIMGWTIEEQGFDFWRRQEIFSLLHNAKTGPTQPPTQWVPQDVGVNLFLIMETHVGGTGEQMEERRM